MNENKPLSYFDLPEVSNSELTALARSFHALPDNREELEDIFNFGSLVDAMLTEKHRVSYVYLSLTEESGKIIYYDVYVFQCACRLAEECLKDMAILQLIKTGVGQYIFRRRLNFDYEGDSYSIAARCKFDLFSRTFKIGTEFKTTACTTIKQFRESVDFFHWDRAAAWYLDIARIDRHWIVGMSKKNDQIFKIAVQRGDSIYSAGKAKYSLWAYRWLIFCENFKTQTV